MSLKEKEYLLKAEIMKLTQREGLTDAEVASLLGYSHSYITKLRIRFNIPKRIIKNRKDKEVKCVKCGKIEYIRRFQRKQKHCSHCLSK